MRAFGSFQIAAVEAGRFKLDGGAMFGIVPRPVWAKHAPPDADNRIDLALRCLLLTGDVDGRRRVVLVDTGIGDKFDAKKTGQLAIASPPHCLENALAAHGVAAAEVTDVILTHLHFDHAGGATVADDRGGFRPTFPSATYHVQRRALDWAEQASERDRASFRPDDWRALATHGQLHLVDGAGELLDGIRVIVSDGHTEAQQLPLIDGGADGKLLYCGDVVPTRAHVRLPWIMGYDLRPLGTLEEKRLMLAEALEEGWTLFFEHDPSVAACRLAEEQGSVVAGETVAF